MRTIKDCLLLLCGLAVSTVCSADRVARIIYYGAPTNAPQTTYVYQADQEPQEIRLDSHNFSESFDLSPGSNRLAFLPSLLPEDAPVPQAAPMLNIPEDWNKVLILAFEDKENPVLPIRLKAINANENVFGSGDTLFVNFSDVTVAGYVGDKKLISKPRSTARITNPRSGIGNYMIKLDVFETDENIRRRLVQQKCQYNPAMRVVTFFVPMPPPRKVKVYSAPIWDF
ncbi:MULTISPECIES: hypothetical protein [unclassified Lentimonas]|uniref:hypothetical protein n=1 Tax=unclassified Lentimonas TaxID=2630993 RepID=UPI001324CA97|nr:MULTISPECIES: hypothetical protein [unclassified Lentimonas]CAA6677954.1 Unannotated [Lentimonas sp. CC4]CAA6686073.1 Unannotated [Lentimonas sp. CC6]CAA7077714.1 Unannotated [Lentimonas sp. CC4]CAA7168450.1 Unannotated [Lentimonas sp. CC21]CAA7182982.1 Unannotated [Lentimonas sp. CC8]